MEGRTDGELVELLRQGHQDAYRILVERHKSYIYTLIFRMVSHRETAEDLTQEVFIKLYRSLESYRAEAKFTTWLYRLTVNMATDYLRSRKRRPAQSALDKVKSWFGDRKEEPEEKALRKEAQSEVLAALNGLPEKYRMILYLYHFKQLSYQQIALALDIPLKTVETRLYRGKAMLKDKWMEVSGHEEKAYSRTSDSAVRKRPSVP